MAGKGSAAWVDVLPNMSKVASSMTKGTMSAAKTAGTAAGRQFSTSMSAGAQSGNGVSSMVAEIERAAKRATKAVGQEKAAIQRAREAERTATASVTAAEAALEQRRVQAAGAARTIAAAEASLQGKRAALTAAVQQAARQESALNAARASGKASATQVQALEASLTAARQRASAASVAVFRSEASLEGSRAREVAATGRISAAEAALTNSRSRASTAAAKFAQQESVLKAAINEQKVAVSQLDLAQTKAGRASLGMSESLDVGAVAADRGDGAFRRATKGVRGMVGGILATAKPLAAMAAGFALIVGAGNVISLGNDYTATINELGAVTNATDAQMGQFRATARSLGSDLTLPATSGKDAAGVLLELSKGGFTAAGAMDAAKGTILLAAAAQVDGARAAEIQANAINQFGLQARDASMVADVLANTANAAAGGVEDIAVSMKYVGPVARTLGIDIGDTAAAVGLLANNGLKGDTAGTALRGMLASLSAPSKQAAGALDELRIKAFDSSGQFVGMRSVIEQLSEAQKRMTKEQFAAAAATAFGREPLAAVSALASSGAGAYDQMTAAVTRQGGAADVANSKMQGLGGAMDKLQSQLEDVALSIYDTVSPFLTGAVNSIATYLDGAGGKVRTFLEAAGGLSSLVISGTVSGELTASTNLLPDDPFVQGILQARGMVVQAFTDIRDFVVSSLVPSLRNIAVAVGPLAAIIGGALLLALRAVATVLSTVIGPALVGVTSFMRDNQGVVIALAAVIGSLVLAYKAQAAAAVVAEAGGLVPWLRTTRAATAATKVQTAALALSKVGLLAWRGAIVIAAASQFALVAMTKGWTYALMLNKGAQVTMTTTTTAATAAQWLFNAALAANPIGLIVIAVVAAVAALAALVAGIVWAYKNVGWFRTAVDAVWSAIKIGAKAVGDAFVWLWQNGIKPAIDWIAAGAVWLWQNALLPAFNGISTAVRFVGAVFSWWWQNVVSPVFTWIGNAASYLWTSYLSPIFELIGAILIKVGEGFVWLWSAAIKPAIDWIVAGVTWLVSTSVAQFTMVTSFLRDVLGAAWNWLYSSVIKPVIDWIVGAVVWWWTTSKANFDAAVGFLRTILGPAFTWLRDTIFRPVFDGISKIVTAVWEGGIRPVFDTLSNFATRTIPDAFTKMKDAVGQAWQALSDAAKVPIRFVVETVINDGIIGNFNKVADFFGTSKMPEVKLPKGFAGGGVIPGYQSAKRDDHLRPMRSGEGVLVPEVVRALGPGFVHGLNRLGNTGGVNGVRKGVGYATGGIVGAASGAWDWIAGKAGAAVDWARDAASTAASVVSDPMGTIGRLVNGIIAKIPGAGGLVEAVGGMGRKILGSVVEKLKSIGFGAPTGGNGSNGQIAASDLSRASGFTGGPGVTSIGGFLRTVAARAWDAARDASGGLLTLTEGYRDLAAQQYRWALMKRGGNLAAAPGTSVHGYGLAADVGAGQAWLRANGPRFGWYPTGLSFSQREPWHFEYKGTRSAGGGGMALGGVEPTLYDNGGILPVGTSIVANKTGKPEPILTNEQWRALRAERSSSGGDTYVVNAEVGGTGNHHEDIRDIRRAMSDRRHGGRGRKQR